MIGYKKNFDQQQVTELSQQIEHYHNEFFEADNPEKKAEALRLMRNYGGQFLFLVPHNQKFIFPATAHVLARSVAMSVFEPRDACEAFENLAKYAQNLYEQPWRKEFHKITLISGFYIHQISAHLSHAEELLVQLKYAATDDTTLVLTSCPDLKVLKAFSRDCLIASQECLILSQIWERVQRKVPDYPMTVQEAFQAREKFVGDVDTVSASVIYIAQSYLRKERQKQEEYEQQQLEAKRLKEVERERVTKERNRLELLDRQRRELQEQERREAQERQLAETRFQKDMLFRAGLMQNAMKAQRDLEIHNLEKQSVTARHVPTDVLVDFWDDNKYTDVPEPDESEVVRHVKINTEKFGSAGTEYNSQFTDRAKKASNSCPLPAKSIANGLPEFEDVAFQYHLNQNKSSRLDEHDDDEAKMDVDPINRSLEENMRNFEEKSSKVEELQIRRSQKFSQSHSQNQQTMDNKDDEEKEFASNQSAFASYKGKTAKGSSSTSLQNGNIKPSTITKISDQSDGDQVDTNRYNTRQVTRKEFEGSSSSGFKNLKQRQDLPKTSSSSSSDSSSFKSVRSKSSVTDRSNNEVKAEKEYNQPPSHLSKSRVSQNKVPDFDDVKTITASTSGFELGSDPLEYSEQELYDLVNLNQDSNHRNKNVSDKGLKVNVEPGETLKKSDYWACRHCTFVNKKCPKICEVCAKSKDLELELSDKSDYPEEEKSYAAAVGASKNIKSTNRSTDVEIQKDSKNFPPLESSRKLSVEKFRAGFGIETDDENSNGRDDWICRTCTLKNDWSRRSCEACSDFRPPDLR